MVSCWAAKPWEHSSLVTHYYLKANTNENQKKKTEIFLCFKELVLLDKYIICQASNCGHCNCSLNVYGNCFFRPVSWPSVSQNITINTRTLMLEFLRFFASSTSFWRFTNTIIISFWDNIICMFVCFYFDCAQGTQPARGLQSHENIYSAIHFIENNLHLHIYTGSKLYSNIVKHRLKQHMK